MNKKNSTLAAHNHISIIKFQGGLGNQMFCYAFGRSLALRRQTSVKYDYSWFEEVKNNAKVTTRHYELGAFCLSAPQATPEECSALKENVLLKRILSASLYKKLNKKELIPNHLQKEKNANAFQPELLQAALPAYFEGYFQCPEYFDNWRIELLRDFQLKIPLNENNQKILSAIRMNEAISLHIRRGDYVSNARANATHGLCSLEYYQKAVRYMAQHTTSPHFFIFSDDLPWAAENLKLSFPHTLVDVNSADEGYFDMFLMSQCRHNIIANSSFSWWGAWLNQNPDKIVIAPQKWNNSGQSPAILYKDWIKF